MASDCPGAGLRPIGLRHERSRSDELVDIVSIVAQKVAVGAHRLMSAVSSPTPFEFTAPVLFDPEVEAGYMKHFVPLPPAVAHAIDESGATRLVGALGDHAFRRVMHTRPDGSRCLKFGEGWLRNAGLGEGAEVAVTLAVDPEPDRVDIPDELAAALDDDAEAATAWMSLTPGRQRTFAYGVERAKRPETRARRAAAVVLEVLRVVEAADRTPRRRRR